MISLFELLVAASARLPAFLMFFACCTSVARAEIIVLFTPSPDVATHIEETIDGAKESIDLAIYGISSHKLVAKIAAAAERGVRVRILLHNARQELKTANTFENAGADVRYVSRTMHHKFAIVDSARLITGSVNWSRTAFSRYDDDLLIFKDEPDYVNSFQSEFNYVWVNAKEFGERRFTEYRRVEPINGIVSFSSSNMTPVSYRGQPTFKTTAALPGACGSQLIAAVDSAKSQVRIATTHYRRKDLHDALVRAAKRGVSVEVVLDQQEADIAGSDRKNSHFDEELGLEHAVVKYKCYANDWNYRTAFQMHCKYLIIDKRRVYTGSLNWSEASELGAFENLVTIQNRDVVRRYIKHFDKVFGYRNIQLREILHQAWHDEDGIVNFKPVSLTWPEVSAIMHSANKLD